MLTPLDIENREFKKKMGGYDRDDVEDFMGLLLNDYEKLYKDNIANRDKIETLTDALNHFKAQEETMNNAILAAQQAADSLTRSASDKADLILKEARFKAAEIVREANADITKLEDKYTNLKQEMENYKLRMSAIVQAQLDILKDINVSVDAAPLRKGEEFIIAQQEIS